jgi:hypothetical protein
VGWEHGLDSCGSGYRQVVCACECSNESLSAIKCGKFFDYMRTCWLLSKDSGPCR